MPVEMARIFATGMENWWEEVNESTQWQDGIFFALCGAYALVSAIALVRSHLSLSLSLKVLVFPIKIKSFCSLGS